MSKVDKRSRRTFTEQFKRDAVNLVVVEGYSFAAAAKAVNVASGSLRQWHKKYAPEPDACGEDATVSELQAELSRLRKQLRQAELEREILQKRRRISRRSRSEVRLDQNTPRHLLSHNHVSSHERQQKRLLRLAAGFAKPTRNT